MTTAARGKLAGAFLVDMASEILVVSTGGTVIRVAVADVARQGRDATGVRVMHLGEGQSVAAIATVTGEEQE